MMLLTTFEEVRMRTFFVSIAASMSLLFLVACGGGSANDTSGNPQIKNEPDETDTALQLKKLPGTLIIVGDSIMAGCAASIIQPSPDYSMTAAHLVAKQGVRVVNLSRSGNSIMTAEIQRVDGGIRFTQGDKRGTAIWITLGVNDFLWGFSTLKQYRERYLTVLSRIEPVPAQKIFCATPLISSFD
jgi:hypothetical protein